MASHSTPADAPGQVLRIDRIMPAPRPFVFALWRKPSLLAPWWGPEGHRLKTCEIDFRPGGAWRFNMVKGDDSHWTHGVYHEIRAPERLVFSYRFDAFDVRSTVSIDFTDEDDRTGLHFVQTGFPNAEHVEGHGWGWGSTFRLLEDALLRLHGIGSVWPDLPPAKENGVARDLEAARQRFEEEREES